MSRKISVLFFILFANFAYSECVGTATSCRTFSGSAFNEVQACLKQDGCRYDDFRKACDGNAKSCGSFNSKNSCQDQRGCAWIAATPTPSPTPTPIPANPGISNLQYNLPGIGLSSIELYSASEVNTNQIPSEFVQDVWYSHDFDRYGNSRTMTWETPNNAKTVWQYKIINGAGSVTAHNPNYTIWQTLYNTSATSEYLSVLPGSFFNDYYSNEVNIPEARYSSQSKNYILIFYRVRTEIQTNHSEWKYLKPIWLYSAD